MSNDANAIDPITTLRAMNHKVLQEREEVAKAIALKVGKKVLEYFNNRSRLLVQQKGLQDLVTQVDQDVEKEITETLLNHFPTDTVFGEEAGGSPSQIVWVIDPIDGTTNFIRGNAYYCISIAFVVNQAIEIGIIYDPSTDELYSAMRGQGAFCNGRCLQASACSQLSEVLIALGFSRRTDPSDYARLIEKLMHAGCEYRRYGAAALMLAHTAAGRFDGFFELHLNSWDALAGLLLCQEAGAYVAPFLHDNALKEGNRALVCPKNLQEIFLQLLEE